MELNPDHPVTKAMHDQWHKMCLLLMCKMGVTEVKISPEEVMEYLTRNTNRAIVVRIGDARGIELNIATPEEAQQMVSERGYQPTHYTHYNGAAMFVKEAEYFESQGGLTQRWGKAWKGVVATDMEDARRKGAELFGVPYRTV